jgi:4-diphosphocytidyl-2-C-methyl-D-erythritol kinase
MSAGSQIVGTTPAKLNLGLEIIGRRPDGYHEIVTILQAVDLVDRFIYEPSGSDFEYLGPSSIEPSGDMVRDVFERAKIRGRWTGRLRLEKGIPVAAGLGGGSSDAAFALRVAYPAASRREVELMATMVGSDAPFFVEGGTALATSTGTQLRPLPTPEMWFVLVVPQVSITRKTARLYEGLRDADFSNGDSVLRAAVALEQGNSLHMPLPNAFTRQMQDVPEVEHALNALHDAGGQAIMLSGAGPGIYAPAASQEQAREIESRVPPSAGFVTVARSLAAHGSDPVPARLNAALRDRRPGR